MKLILFFCLLSIRLLSQSEIKNYNSEFHQSLELIKLNDVIKYNFLLKSCNKIIIGEETHTYQKNDSTIVIPKNVIDSHSLNYLTCFIVHQLKHIEIVSWSASEISSKRAEYICYQTEYGFFTKLQNTEDWLRELIVGKMIEYNNSR